MNNFFESSLDLVLYSIRSIGFEFSLDRSSESVGFLLLYKNCTLIYGDSIRENKGSNSLGTFIEKTIPRKYVFRWVH